MDIRQTRAAQWLTIAAATWFGIALLAQWAFGAYIVAFYGPALANGEFESWNRLAALGVHPYRPGDSVGNLSFLAHALGAGVIALGGAVQLIPSVRRRWPRFHRINGRLFLLTVVLLTLTGLYLVWLRNEPPATLVGLATTVNGLLILGFAWLTMRHARARELVAHRRWALRLYLVSNAQWFMRIGVFAWFVFNGLLGRQAKFADAFIAFWSFGCFLVPLAVLELYLRARERGGAAFRYAMAAMLALLTLLTLAGSVAFGLFSLKLVAGSVGDAA